MAVELLEEAKDVKILVTSRQRLNVHGEQLFPLSGLKIPQTGVGLDLARQSEAVKLFLAAGQRARPGFELSERNLESVTRICELVGGLPLGLLLAAAWLDALSAVEVAAEIEGGLDFLSVEWGNIPGRQRSLRATFDYSWKLLAQDEKQVASSLAVFRGGFNPLAAREVAGAKPHNLRALVEKSMLQRTLTGRYEMHELLRQYAWEKQREAPENWRSVEETHAAFYLGKLAGWAKALKGAGQRTALDEMDLERGNLASSWTWASENKQVQLLDVGLEGLMVYFDLRGRLNEGQSACQYALVQLPKEINSSVKQFLWAASAWKSHFTRLLGQHDAAAQQLRQVLADQESLDLNNLSARMDRAHLLLELGYATLPSDRQAAKQSFQESLAIYEDLGEAWHEARALAGLGTVAHHSGTFEEAVRLYQRCLPLYERLGDPTATAGVLIELGHNSLRQGLLEEGESFIQRGSEIYEQIGDRASAANNLLQLSRLGFWRGDFTESLSYADKALPLFEELGWLDNYTFALTGKGIVLVLTGSYKAARERGDAGLAFAQENKFQRWEAIAYWVLRMTEVAAEEHQKARNFLQRSIDVYRAIAQNDELGWALAAHAYAELKLGNQKAFWKSLCEALHLSLEIKGLFPILLSLPAFALYLIKRSRTAEGEAADRDVTQAVEMYALARRYPPAGNAQWFEDVAGDRIYAAAASLPPEEAEAAQTRGQERDLFETAEALLAEYCS